MNMGYPKLRLSDHGTEAVWHRPLQVDTAAASSNVTFRRFVDPSHQRREVQAKHDTSCYSLCVNLLRGRITAFQNGRQVFDGNTQPGMIQIGHPGDELREIQYKPVDCCLMYLPTALLKSMLEESGIDASSGGGLLQRADFVFDRRIFGLVHSLLEAAPSSGKLFEQLYVDGLSMAVLSSVLGRYSSQSNNLASSRRYGLTGRQVRKIEDFVDANIGKQISLLALADVLGLSRMHFAAQFRQSTGLRPHEYVVQERIRHAQQMLQKTALPVLEVALGVGFETQSHFSTVFKRIVGETPARWRAIRKH